MSTARSEIATVKALDLRSINNAINAISQQLRVIAAAADAANDKAALNAFTAKQSAGSLIPFQQQLASLQTAVAALTAGSQAPTLSYRADAAVVAFDPVYPTSDGGVSPVDTQDPTAIFAVVGVATSSVSSGGNVTVRRSGAMDITGADFEAGRAVYAEIGSGLTQYPSYAGVAIPIGVALTSTTMDVRPAWPALLAVPPYAGHEDFMPVALAAVRDVLEFVSTLFGQEDGFVVKVGNQLITRSIITPSGSGLDITDGDGVHGDPSIVAVP